MFQTNSSRILDLRFQLSDTSVMYRRKVYGIVDLLSALGGLSSLIFYVFGTLIHIFAKSEFRLAIFNEGFKVRAQSFNFKDFDVARKFD